MKQIVIMADGKGMRWNNYMGIPKHFAVVKGEELISRIIRLIRQENKNIEIIVTSHDKRYEFKESIRYEPINNNYEIDRFTEELIEDDMCFLYGDTFYTEESINKILEKEADDILFFGNKKTIVAVKIKNAEIFKKHRDKVKKAYIDGKISKCTGWEVYRSFTEQNFKEPLNLGEKFIIVDDLTTDVDTPLDYELIEK